MDLIIKHEKADFNESKLGNSKKCVIVQFPNCISLTTNKPFKWMPTYKQINEIRAALIRCEEESWKK